MGFSCEAVFTAALVIITGLLFIDLVPLQETMRCPGNYTNSTECPEVFFAATYELARERFLAAAEAAKAELGHHEIVKRGGNTYFMDTAFFRGARSDKLLVHVSGTHGVEGYTGSAIQVKLLQEWNETATSGPSILFVHAVNPYGMAHFRRFNEKNVDLNRNYLSAEQWAAVKTRDTNIAGYDDLRSLFVPDASPRFIDRYVFLLRAARAATRHGMRTLKRALVSGQYHDADGVFYGGDGEQRSVTVLREVLRKYAAVTGVTEAVFIDIHTGLGPTGVDTMMVSKEEDVSSARKVFPGVTVQGDESATSGPSSGYDLAVGVVRPLAELGPKTLAVTEEFGTINPMFVARAIILENAAHRLCPGSYVHATMQTWMRDAFYPQEVSYKRATLKRGSEAFWSAWTHLNATPAS